MSICIHDIQKGKITSAKIGFLAPLCVDCIVSYILTTKDYTIKIIPKFHDITVINADTHVEEVMILEAFCKKYIDPLDAIVLCTDLDEECSVQQIINDIQIFKMDTQEETDDVIYHNDRLDHGQTCNSIHWHYQRTMVTVNKNSPLMCNLPHRHFATCYLPKARFTEMRGLNLHALCLCQNQCVTDINQFCAPQAIGLLPWCKRMPPISSCKLRSITATDWYVGVFATILIALGLVIIHTKYRKKVCYT
jgi:hypothetical protein